jgi:superfamily II DNA or RNA helicase
VAETKAIKVWARDSLYLKSSSLDEDDKYKIAKRFTKDFYNKETVCEKCEYFDQRPCDVCDSCANYGGRVSLAREVLVDEKKFVRVPYGGMNYLRKNFGPLKVVDQTASPAMRKPIKFTRTLREDQIKSRDAIIVSKHGILKSPPRTGKTVIGAAAICELGLKTLILAAQTEWLDNFLETFIGSEKEKAFTNASPKRVGMAKTLAQIEALDVCLMTYQTFLSEKGQRLLHKVRKKFGVIMVDEIQGGSAKAYSATLNKFHAEYRIGLSGTPERKDGKEWVLDQLFGPVFYENKVKRMVPRVMITETKFRGPVPQSWVYMVRKIEFDPARLKLIAEQAIRDVDQGHLVLIPMARVDAINALTKAINIMRGTKVARSFHGGMGKEHRKETIMRACAYKTKIVVGMMRLLSTGVNIPRASALYEVTPSSNIPKSDQRFSRILTPYEGKPQPIIRYFLDDVDVRRNCLRTEFFHCLLPKFRPHLSEEVRKKLYEYMGTKSKKEGATNKPKFYTGGVL